MPVKYLPPIPLPPKEFVEPVADDYFIWWLFKNRCVKCKKSGTEINEIVPRSRSKKSISTWENRVLMCSDCHREYHRKGVNEKAITELTQIRKDFLLNMGREEYVDFIPLAKIEIPELAMV